MSRDQTQDVFDRQEFTLIVPLDLSPGIAGNVAGS